jgi:hypothetical protein
MNPLQNFVSFCAFIHCVENQVCMTKGFDGEKEDVLQRFHSGLPATRAALIVEIVQSIREHVALFRKLPDE